MTIFKSKVTKIQLNTELKKLGYEMQFWYDRSGKQWIITGINNRGEWFTSGLKVFALHQLSFEQWIEQALINYTN